MILNDAKIREYARDHGMIEPFEPLTKGRNDGLPSWGTGPHTYNPRWGTTFKIPRASLEPLDQRCLPSDHETYDVVTASEGGAFVIYPGQFVLAHTLECFRIPQGIRGQIFGKSTWLRVGIWQGDGYIDEGFHGQITLEVLNVWPRPIVIVPGSGAAQVEFELVEPAEQDYAALNGKYNGQKGAQPARSR